MNWASVCTGIGAPEMAWKDLPQWACQWMAEIEPFPSKVLNHYYPDVPNLGDMTKLNEHEHYNQSTIDLLVGGTPCQSFSIAGLRGGMADQRGNLSLEYCRILLAKQPKWFLWENVPGVFSSFSDAAANTDNFHIDPEPGDEYTRYITETSDFATLLTAFRECGYSVSYRVFDSKHFGVPQRRRRVFVVGHLGNDWRPSAAVLFERDSLRRDFTPGKEKRKRTSGTTEEGIRSYGINSTAIGRKPGNGGNGLGISNEIAPTLTKADKHGVFYFDQQRDAVYANKGEASTLSKRDYKEATDLIVKTSSFRQSSFGNLVNEDISGTLKKNGGDLGCGSETILVSEPQKWPADLAPTLNTYYGTKQSLENQHIDSGAPLFVPFIMPTTQGDGAGKILENQSATLNCMHEQPVLFQPVNINPPLILKIRGGKEGGGKGYLGQENESFTITKGGNQYLFNQINNYPSAPLVSVSLTKGANQTTGFIGECLAMSPFQVRRLTPLECGRLQGFPDGYGNISGASDTSLYAAFGNSMTVHVMKWIGERIDRVDKLLKSFP